MNLYLISQTKNTGYDTYDSAVVAAETAEAARFTYPNHNSEVEYRWNADSQKWEQYSRSTNQWLNYYYLSSEWADPANVTVKLLGTAVPDLPAGVVCASYNAG